MDFKNLIFLDDFNDLDSLKSVLEDQYKKNLEKLQELSFKDDADSNRLRSRIIGNNEMIIAITSKI